MDVRDYDRGDDDYDPLHDDTPAKEEPDCYTCTDRGCPSCGYVNPDDPDHLQAVAVMILQARIPMVPRDVPDDESWFTHLPAEAIATIRELVTSAVVSTEIRWRTPAEQAALDSTELPF